MLRTPLFTLAAVAALIGSALPAAAAESDPSAFITDLGTEAIHILQTQHEAAGRRAAFFKLFTADFDSPAIGRFVLGRYWRTATPEQQKQYLQAFEQYVVTLYAARFSAYNGEQFKVVSTRASDPTSVTVSSLILPPNNGPAINIGWQVAKEDSSYKITDVTVDNLSLAITKRDEFASVLQQNGGDIPALIDMLKQKAEQG